MGIADVIKSVTGSAVSDVISKAEDIIGKAVTDKDLKQKLSYDLEALRQTQAHETELAAINAEVQLTGADERVEIAKERTYQTEIENADLYTKRTRPMIARRSFYLGVAYAFASMFAQLYVTLHEQQLFADMTGEQIDHIRSMIEFRMDVFLVIISPALAYMGARSVDLWRSGGAKRV